MNDTVNRKLLSSPWPYGVWLVAGSVAMRATRLAEPYLWAYTVLGVAVGTAIVSVAALVGVVSAARSRQVEGPHVVIVVFVVLAVAHALLELRLLNGASWA